MPTTDLGTYRFLRFVKEPVKGRKNQLNDIVKVYYDIDSSPEGFFDPDEFLEFLQEKFNIAKEHPNLLIQIKKALSSYGIHFILDVKHMKLSAMEGIPAEAPKLKEDMKRLLNESQKSKKKIAGTYSTRQLQKSHGDVFDKLGGISLN